MKKALKPSSRFFRNDGFLISFFRLSMAVTLIMDPVFSTAAPVTTSPTEAHLKGISYENNLVRIELDKTVPYRIFSLTNPPRVVVEISQAVHSTKPYETSVKNDLLKRIRSAQFQVTPEKIMRVVLDVSRLAPYEASENGGAILLRFLPEGSSAQTKTVPEIDRSLDVKAMPETTPAHKTVVSGQKSGVDHATVTATAPAASQSSTNRRKAARDLLASLPKHPVTIDFDEADIRDVVRVLSEMSDINMIHSPDLRGVVSIHLEQVPFNEAFNTILTMYGLVAQQMGDNILRILTPEALSVDRSRAVTVTKTFSLNYSKAAEVQAHLSAVQISPNAAVTVDERSNSLVITDTPEGIAAAERLLADLDKKPQQVMIEAKMVEVILSDNLDLGIQWEYAQTKQQGQKQQIVGQRDVEAGGTNVSPGEAGFVTGAGVENAFTSAERGTGVSLPGPQSAAITFGFISNTTLLTATLTALAQKGQTKVLSAPKIITVNNKQAKIQVGSKVPFSITTVAATGIATQSFEFVDIGIILTVTPTINADNRVRVNVKPEVSFPGAVGPAGPEINTRNAETEVIIEDGETLVIGGLIDESMRESAQKVPLLGDIPVLGVFFRNTSESKRRSELLVFVTPRIIRD